MFDVDSSYASRPRLYEFIGRDIVQGHYDANFPTEAEICERYRASRSVVREAVKILNTLGVLESRPKVGTYVLPLHNWKLLDCSVIRFFEGRQISKRLFNSICEFRLSVEPAAMNFAVAKGTAQEVNTLQKELEKTRQAGGKEHEVTSAHFAFHRSVLSASKNFIFAQFADIIEFAIRYSIERLPSTYQAEFNSTMCDDLMAAIRSRDSAGAEAALRRLLESQFHHIEALDAGWGNDIAA